MNKMLSGIMHSNSPTSKAATGLMTVATGIGKKVSGKSTTGLAVTGLGVVVTGIGRSVGGSLGAGLIGFGMAHVALGMLDMFRPTVMNNPISYGAPLATVAKRLKLREVIR